MPNPNQDLEKAQQLIDNMNKKYAIAVDANCNPTDYLYDYSKATYEYKNNMLALESFVDSFIEFGRLMKDKPELLEGTPQMANYKQIVKDLSGKLELTGIHKLLRNKLLDAFGAANGAFSEETEFLNDTLNSITHDALAYKMCMDYSENEGEDTYADAIRNSIINRKSNLYLLENSFIRYSQLKDDNLIENGKDSPYLGFYLRGIEDLMHVENTKDLTGDKLEAAKERNEYSKNLLQDLIQDRYYIELKKYNEKSQPAAVLKDQIEEMETALRIRKGAGYGFKEAGVKKYKQGFVARKFEDRFKEYAQKIQASLQKLDTTNGAKKGEKYSAMESALGILRKQDKSVFETIMDRGDNRLIFDPANRANTEYLCLDLESIKKNVDDYIDYKFEAGTYGYFNGKKRYEAANDIKNQLDGMITLLKELDDYKKKPYVSNMEYGMIQIIEELEETNVTLEENNKVLDAMKKKYASLDLEATTAHKHLKVYDDIAKSYGISLERHLQEEDYNKKEHDAFTDQLKAECDKIVISIEDNDKIAYLDEAKEDFWKSTGINKIERLDTDDAIKENRMNYKLNSEKKPVAADIVATVTMMNIMSKADHFGFDAVLKSCKAHKMPYEALKDEMLKCEPVKSLIDNMTNADIYKFITDENMRKKLAIASTGLFTKAVNKRIVDLDKNAQANQEKAIDKNVKNKKKSANAARL